MRFAIRTALLLATVTLASLAACSSPGASTDEDDGSAATLEGLSEGDVEGAAARALASAERARTDFEPGEGNADRGGDVAPSAATVTSDLRPLSLHEDLDRALGAGVWAYAFRITRDGRTATDLATQSTDRIMYAASVFKVVTGFTAFAHRAVADDTLTFMLRTSNNALANFSMCKNGELLGGYRATCSSVAYATSAMKMGNAIQETTKWLREEQGVALSSSFSMKDGSGLLPQNRMTIDDVTSVLMAARRHDGYERFKNMLAQPGKASTLRARFAGLEGRVFAKTGTYPSTGKGTKTLAGFVELSGGRTMVFAVFGNGVGAVSPAMGRIEGAVKKAIRAADENAR
ncbi:MAG: D-alanyl-D-alanine carboxypeptidase [Deltaproteobacteria bacterium]|nr:D-alanyl-D-alanine carboxypeptidase [Deltaproteobacteria bacterium]